MINASCAFQSPQTKNKLGRLRKRRSNSTFLSSFSSQFDDRPPLRKGRGCYGLGSCVLAHAVDTSVPRFEPISKIVSSTPRKKTNRLHRTTRRPTQTQNPATPKSEERRIGASRYTPRFNPAESQTETPFCASPLQSKISHR